MDRTIFLWLRSSEWRGPRFSLVGGLELSPQSFVEAQNASKPVTSRLPIRNVYRAYKRMQFELSPYRAPCVCVALDKMKQERPPVGRIEQAIQART
jgi:hypothetical protein